MQLVIAGAGYQLLVLSTIPIGIAYAIWAGLALACIPLADCNWHHNARQTIAPPKSHSAYRVPGLAILGRSRYRKRLVTKRGVHMPSQIFSEQELRQAGRLTVDLIGESLVSLNISSHHLEPAQCRSSRRVPQGISAILARDTTTKNGIVLAPGGPAIRGLQLR